MIDRHRFLDKLRQLGYTHHRDHKSNLFFRKRGEGHRDHMPIVPRRGTIKPEYARECLAKAGCSDEEIERFLSES